MRDCFENRAWQGIGVKLSHFSFADLNLDLDLDFDLDVDLGVDHPAWHEL